MPRCTAPSPGTTRTSGRCSNSMDSARAPMRQFHQSETRRPMIRELDDKMMVSSQVAPEEVAGLVDLGVTLIVNNRPDGEDPGQPLSAEVEAAAKEAGI